ncbi:MAG: 3-oxoacyl-[acyl-carrier-protein] synthase III C-terminal domain-containing protein [Candidatus Didemnitutus sp.]|nr:3-oxoacyl-[acyl-carrier-protein] synthase III C-terminal domain-containing protein [Candidatus Didemnitutus sp.]
MYLHALSTALPPTAFRQTECWEILQRSDMRQRLNRRSVLTLQAILRHDSGIATRHFALPDIERVFSMNPDELNEAFRTEAPRLAARALETALAQAGMTVGDVDALLICTCTGYLCPGVTSYVAEQLGLRANTYLQDLVGLGCGAAIPTLRAAAAILAAQPEAVVACVAVEVCSAAFYLDDDPGVLVSACLFGDGAAATIWRSQPGPSGLQCRDFSTLHQPEHRDRIRFETRQGRLRNLLDAAVPELAAAAVAQLLADERARRGARPISRLIAHVGGRDVLDAIARSCDDCDLTASRDVLRDCGNMSSPSVLFALERALQSGAPDDASDWWLTSFGAGFSAHGCRIGRG